MLNKLNKKTMLLLSMAAIVLIGVGGSIAFLVTQSAQVVNEFTTSFVNCKVIEDEFNGETKTGVKVQNTGDIDAYIRAEIVVNWKNDAGEVYGANPKAGVDYRMRIPTDTGWFEKGGFYYYTDAVAPKDTPDDKDKTGILIALCEPIAGQAPDGYYLNVEILASAIQAKGVSDGVDDPGTVKNEPAVKNAWGVAVGEDSKLTN